MTAARCSSGTSFRLICSFLRPLRSRACALIALGFCLAVTLSSLRALCRCCSVIVCGSYVRLPRSSQTKRCQAARLHFEYSKNEAIWLKQGETALLGVLQPERSSRRVSRWMGTTWRSSRGKDYKSYSHSRARARARNPEGISRVSLALHPCQLSFLHSLSELLSLVAQLSTAPTSVVVPQDRHGGLRAGPGPR
jgi:hypothetical protein